MKLQELPTPTLLLDRMRMERNIARLKQRLTTRGVALRPHLKTAKCVEIARLLMTTPAGPATVSTLKEAEAFADAGVRDMIYAVGIAPAKLERVIELRRRGVEVTVILDSVEQARAVTDVSQAAGLVVPALIEIDSDSHRAGLRPGDPMLLDIGRILHGCGALRGVLTHAGGSYDARSTSEIVQAAERERSAAVECATTLRAAGLPCPVVSVGSTPTAHFAENLAGVTEIRAGVFVFFDLVMAGLGVCTLDDIAISVLATVIGHRPDKGQTLIDAGWMALSRDRGTSSQAVDQGYGVVCDAAGRPFPHLVVKSVHQEHGIIEPRSPAAPGVDLPLGSLVRILPNHACATAAQHQHYIVIDGASLTRWPRIASGW